MVVGPLGNKSPDSNRFTLVTPKQDPLDLSMYGLETNSQESPSNSAPKNKAKSSPTPPNVDPNYVPPSEDDYPW